MLPSCNASDSGWDWTRACCSAGVGRPAYERLELLQLTQGSGLKWSGQRGHGLFVGGCKFVNDPLAIDLEIFESLLGDAVLLSPLGQIVIVLGDERPLLPLRSCW